MAQKTKTFRLKDSPAAYGAISRVNHWGVAFGMIALLGSGLLMAYGPLTREAVAPIRDWHKALGVVVLIVGLWRVGWRLAQGAPRSASDMPLWQARAAKAVHWGLLATVLAMPISGILMSVYNGRAVTSFGVVIPALDKVGWIANAAHGVHQFAGWALAGLLVVHVAGALKHHFLDHDATLRRMLRGAA